MSIFTALRLSKPSKIHNSEYIRTNNKPQEISECPMIATPEADHDPIAPHMRSQDKRIAPAKRHHV